MKTKREKRSWLNNTILFLVTAIALVIVLSVIGSLIGLEGSYTKINSVTGASEKVLVTVESLFSREGARYVIGNVLTTFMSFTPLVMFLFSMIGIGFAEKVGLFKALFGVKKRKIKKFWLSFFIALVSIISTFIGDIGFVIIIPISAIIFLANNRNPIIAIFTSFAAITAGYGVNLFVTQMDYNLYGTTLASAQLLDKTYALDIYGNLFFGIVCTILLSLLIAFVTEKFTVKRAKKYKVDDIIEEEPLTKESKKGLRFAFLGAFICLLFFVYMLLPIGTPLAGLLLDYSESSFYGRVFSSNSYVIQGLSFMISMSFIICGYIYGRIAKTLKTKNDFSNYLYNSLDNIGSILVLFFFAAELITLFKKTNLGTIFTIKAMDLIETANFSGFILVLVFFILIALVNLFQTSAVSKWTVLAPIMIPLFMKNNISPEFTQAIFKASDSVTNMITPLFPYFAVLIGMLQIYNKSDETIGIKYTYKLLFPYFLAVFIFWIVILLCWYIINIPIGIGVYPVL